MRLRIFPGLLVVTLVAIGLSAYSATARHSGGGANQQQPANQADPISGSWDVSFFVNGPRTLRRLISNSTAQSYRHRLFRSHGSGTVRNSVWADGKLSFTSTSKKHESIAIKGALKDGKLAGEFTTEGFTAKWEAQRSKISFKTLPSSYASPKLSGSSLNITIRRGTVDDAELMAELARELF